jgi:signal transduction histidine kinase
MQDVRPGVWQGLTVKTVLMLGFGMTAALWLFAGLQFADRLRTAQRDAGTVNERYMRAQELLSSVRAQVLLGSMYVRDALLDPDPASAAGYRQQLEDSYRTAELALGRYVPVLDSPTVRSRVAALRREIEDFRRTSIDVLTGDRSRWSTQAGVVLASDIGPRRDAVVRVSDEIQEVNRTAFVQQQAELAALYAAAQRRVWMRLSLALGVSLLIAIAATFYVVRLERDLQRGRTKQLDTTEELQRLSARLVSAQEDERRTIARELHDEIGQELTAIKVELSLAQRAIEAAGGSRQILDDAQAIADGALNTVRDLSHLLHPSLLDDLGLPATVDWYITGLSRRHGLRIDLVQEGMDIRLSRDVESTAFRIVQEALANVVKHAKASSCYVYLGFHDDVLRVVVQDDGCGFDLASRNRAAGRRGLGLIGIRERAAYLGGTARVESTPGQGTRLTAEVPGRVRTALGESDESADLVVDGRPLSRLEAMRG